MKRIFILLLLTISLNAVAQDSNNTLTMQHYESTTFSLVMPSIRQLQ